MVKWLLVIAGVIVLFVGLSLVAFIYAGAQRPSGKLLFSPPPQSIDAVAGREFSYSLCTPAVSSPGATCGGIVSASNPVGGKPPYSFSVEFGKGFLPPGVALNLNGLLSGTPSQQGEYSFGVCASDGFGERDCKQVSISVVAEGGVTPAPTAMPEPTTTQAPAGEEWSVTLEGVFNQHDGNYAPCLGSMGGAFSESLTAQVALPSSLRDALANGFVEGTGSLSGVESVAQSPRDSYCKIFESTVDGVALSVQASNTGKPELVLMPSSKNSLWASRTTLSGTPFTAPHQRLVLTPESINDGSVTGSWRSYPLGASGTFTMTRK